MARVKDSRGECDSTETRNNPVEAPMEVPEEVNPPAETSPERNLSPPLEETNTNAEEDEEQEEEAGLSSSSKETDDDIQPMQPKKFFFGQTEYTKACKIGMRCMVKQVVELIENLPAKLKWFRKHPQFKHVIHMAKETNHMLQGMWMMLFRTVATDKEKECWFVVNGVPIRYSLREHALLCGFNWHEYPNNYKELGDLKFVEKMFGRTDKITVVDVEKKLENMRSCIDRKKLVVLYFFCKVVKAKCKVDGNIDSFLLRVVDDLYVCETFPWGRYTFDD